MLSLSRRTAPRTVTIIAAAAAASSSSASASGSASTPPAESTPEAPAPSRRRRRQEQPVDGTVDLVAPPDPLSNMRPVLYASPHRRPSNSPYSASEFPASMTGKAAVQSEREMAWTMMRERVDIANHRFWAVSNAEFQAQRDSRLAALPPASDPPTKEDEAAREAVLTQFYRDWQIGTRDRQRAWVKQWWSDVWRGIKTQARVYVGRWV